MPLKVLLVCGQFDDKGGRESGYFSKAYRKKSQFTKIINGGKYKSLEKLSVADYDIILWFADVPDNTKSKLVNSIKERNQKCVLVTSKNNIDEKYKPLDIIERALRTKSNLLVEFKKNSNGLIIASIWDALGNIYIKDCINPEWMLRCLDYYCHYFHSSTRIRSKSVGPAEDIPDEKEFFKLARNYAKKFHKLIHAVNTERFVGNLSFRCENGFPSFKRGNRIYVSRRNIDKRDISKNGFVSVKANSLNEVQYFGDLKPSVDTPIQLRLFKMFPEINYLLHCHCYVTRKFKKGKKLTKKQIQEILDSDQRPWYEIADEIDWSKFPKPPQETGVVVPCGDLRELHEIEKLGIPKDATFLEVNLLGHGSIVGAKDINQLKGIEYCSREVPEMVCYKMDNTLLDPIRVVEKKDILNFLKISEEEWIEKCRNCHIIERLIDPLRRTGLVFSITRSIFGWQIQTGDFKNAILVPDERKPILRFSLEDALKELIFQVKSETFYEQ